MTLAQELPVRAVLFDYGHTLVDFTIPEMALNTAYEVIRRRLMDEVKVELPAPPELVDRVANRVAAAVDESYRCGRLVELDIVKLFSEALAGLGCTPTPEMVRWVVETEHEALSAHLTCSNETLETLAILHEAGLLIGIVSNAHLLSRMMRRDWDRLGFGQFIGASAVSSDLGFRKPDRRMFLSVLDSLAVPPEDAIFVGDRALDDIQGAHGVGMRAILTTEFHNSSGRVATPEETAALDFAKPDQIVGHLYDILPYVMDWVETAIR